MSAGRGSASIAAGRVGRAHGLDGSFYVTRPVPRLLTLGTRVELGGSRREIVRRAGTDERPIVRLSGIEDRDAASAIRGLELAVEQAGAPELGQDEYWAQELEGCAVTAGGERIGEVVRLLALPSCEALEVRRDDGGGIVLVPMVRAAIREVHVQERRVEVDLDFLDLPAGGRTRGGGA